MILQKSLLTKSINFFKKKSFWPQTFGLNEVLLLKENAEPKFSISLWTSEIELKNIIKTLVSVFESTPSIRNSQWDINFRHSCLESSVSSSEKICVIAWSWLIVCVCVRACVRACVCVCACVREDSSTNPWTTYGCVSF